MAATPFNDTFLRACRKQAVPRLPVWYMRQAGRYQPEYRAIKANRSLLDIVASPELCTEVTLLPVQQLGVDAAILFSDIITPLGPMGVPFEIRDGVGPRTETPVRTAADIARLHTPDFTTVLPHVGETIRLLRQALNVPLIGFCGAPFTLACYLVEGGPSKHYARVRGLMYGETALWHRLMETLTAGMAAYLAFQAQSGAQALQVFDSWVGQLTRADYDMFVLPHMQALFTEVQRLTNVPLLHFGVDTGHLLESLRAAGGNVIGLDWRVEVASAWWRLNYEVAVQGNLDPGLLLGPWDLIDTRARRILAQVDRPGFIFNLGHGVLPQTPVEILQRLTRLVHEHAPITPAAA
ncbi:MAG: uroporphyrinogen decarboxylase [Lentisphaerae bacterium]|nr:uroporphyrinogen decarboxylase [Lentisphaerota bacterium]